METVQRCSSTEKNAWKVLKQLAQNSSEGKSSNLKKGKENEKPFWFEVGLYSSEANKVLQNQILSPRNVSKCYKMKVYVFENVFSKMFSSLTVNI